MAVTPTITYQVGEADQSIMKASWVLTTADPTGLAVQVPEWADKTWDMSGTLGAAVCSIEGANNDVDAQYATMNDAAGGTALTLTAVSPPQCKMQIQNPLFSRPKLTTPGAGASLTVTLCARRANPLRQ